MGVRREAREALAAAGLRPRKRWGQHFLCDPAAAERIVDTAALGPGSIALEIDPGLVAQLRVRHGEDPRVRIVQGDVLALPLGEIVTEPAATVVANLPYNIATPVLFRLLDLRARFPRAVVMLQREMALRLAARPGTDDYGV